MFIVWFLVTCLLMSGGGLGILMFFKRFDAECAFKLKYSHLALLALYYIGCSYAVCITPDIFTKVLTFIAFMILGTEGFVDLQTSCVYILQTACLFAVMVIGFLVNFINGNVVDHVFASSEGISGSLASMLTFHDASVIGFLIAAIVILYFLSAIRAVALGDVFILLSIALLYLCKDTIADQRFLYCILTAYGSYVALYLWRFISDKVKKKEKVWGKRYPFTAPIALGALVGFLIF